MLCFHHDSDAYCHPQSSKNAKGILLIIGSLIIIANLYLFYFIGIIY